MHLSLRSIFTVLILLSLIWTPLWRHPEEIFLFVYGEFFGVVTVLLLLLHTGHINSKKHGWALGIFLFVWIFLAILPLVGLCAHE